ncbi:MAG TPA: hypothetical protein VNG51_23925 [Ktedonobacteraceae bacterium]|nr:hypothetical protein [Ktedonobacteraceae bacterium]
MYKAIDPEYNKAAADTFARRLKDKFQRTLEDSIEQQPTMSSTNESEALSDNVSEAEPIDAKAAYENKAIEKLRYNQDFMEQMQGRGIPWGGILRLLADELPDTIENKSDVAYYLVREALERSFGPRDEAWHTYKQTKRVNLPSG